MLDRSSHAGVIRFAKGSRELECTIRNASASLAELKGTGVESAPHRFELQEGADRPPREVTVIWRKLGILSVRFDDYFLRR
jgi:hypothetical protein